VSADLVESDTPATYPVGQGQEHDNDVEQQPDLGSLIGFQVWLRRGLLRPAWAALCGALASGGLVLAVEPLLQLALLVFLVDVVWGGVWSAVAATDWAKSLGYWQSWQRGTPVRFLPYTSPDGPAGRLARTWGQLRSWWAELVRPTLGPTLAGLALLLPLAMVIAAVLGVLPLLATLVAITLVQFIFVWTGGDARPMPGLQALYEITLAWLAGHALFDSPTLPSTLLALWYGLTYAGGLRVGSSLRPWNLGQIGAVIVLVGLGQPVAAGVAGLLLFGQALMEPGLFDPETEQVVPEAAARFYRVAQPWLMAAMLAAAWGVRASGAGG
jgi:hypothetical protein